MYLVVLLEKYFNLLSVFFLVASVLVLLNNPSAKGQGNLMDMAFFPKGEFWMGSPKGIGRHDEQPRHKVFLDAFYLDIFEVTGSDFESFLKAFPKEHPTITGWFDRTVRPGMEGRPVIGLSWRRCVRFCRWRGKRLPTEAEWERAAAGLEERHYPWGNDSPDKEKANFNRCCFIMKGRTLDVVGTHLFGATPEGVHDLAGNIAEWVHDWYDKMYYKRSSRRNPRGPEEGDYHVVRGGAWNSVGFYLRSSSRYGYDDGKDFYGIGCRCAKSSASVQAD